MELLNSLITVNKAEFPHLNSENIVSNQELTYNSICQYSTLSAAKTGRKKLGPFGSVPCTYTRSFTDLHKLDLLFTV